MLSFLGFKQNDTVDFAPDPEILSLTHKCMDFLSLDDIANELSDIKKRLLAENEADSVRLTGLNQLLDQLTGFELGRFLIKNKGALSGGWTYYIISGYTRRRIEHELESLLLARAPTILATRERFQIFQRLLIDNIKSNSVVCSIPCGLMADLTTLELADDIKNIKFVGIDLDVAALAAANDFAKMNMSPDKVECEFRQRDAWDIGAVDEFDIVTSNGLNVYEKDNARVVQLYRQIFQSLKPGALFIGSALSVPPSLSPNSEWRSAEICKQDLDLQRTIFVDVLRASWQNFRSSKESKEQLEAAGFQDVTIYPDSKNIFYTMSARKPKL